jgi:N-acetylneuraminic acid mutarotase
MRKVICWLLWMSLVGWAWGQQAASNPSTVPTVIRFSGNLADANDKPLSGMVGVTFSLYADQQGGAALWVETQNVQADKSGHYAVTLGSTTTQGLPQAIFASGEARWLAVQPQGQAERPRVLLMSVPYALKAGDAETVGGLPPSAFVLAAPSPRGSTVVTAGSPPLGGSGTMNYIPIWTDNTGDLGNSVLYQTSAGMVGIGTTTPAATLDVGTGNISIDSGNLNIDYGNLNLPATGGGNVGVIYMGGATFIHACCALSAGNTAVGNTALGFNQVTHNTAVGYEALANSNAPDNTASGYQALVSNGQGKSNTAVGSGALLQNTTGNLNTAVGNGAGFTNTTAGSNNTLVGAGADVGVDGLTFAAAIGSNAIVNESNALVLGGTGANAVKVGIGTATPAATLDVQGTGNFTGLITFAPNQTFPGTGSGTVTSVGSGAGLTGGPITSSGTLSIANAGVTDAMLANPGLTVSAGTDLTGGGPVVLGGSTTLNLDTTKVPQLGTANSFAATQTVNGLVAITGSGNGVQFPDGTLQTTAATGGGGIPSGSMIFGTSPIAPAGYTVSGGFSSGDVWFSGAPMPTARAALAAVALNGKIYAIGGVDPSGAVLNTVEVYDPATNSWGSAASMPTARDGLTATVVAGKIYAIGGCTNCSPFESNPSGVYLGTLEIYDPSSDSWTEGASMPTARWGLAGAAANGEIYAMGGSNVDPPNMLNTVERYDPGSNTWGKRGVKPLPVKTANLAAAAVNGKIYAIGGGVRGINSLSTVQVFDLSTDTWSQPTTLPGARAGLAADVVNGKIYTIGGIFANQTFSDVEVYDPPSNSWATDPKTPTRGAFWAAADANGFMYVIGGESFVRLHNTRTNAVQQFSIPVLLYTYTKN